MRKMPKPHCFADRIADESAALKQNSPRQDPAPPVKLWRKSFATLMLPRTPMNGCRPPAFERPSDG